MAPRVRYLIENRSSFALLLKSPESKRGLGFGCLSFVLCAIDFLLCELRFS